MSVCFSDTCKDTCIIKHQVRYLRHICIKNVVFSRNYDLDIDINTTFHPQIRKYGYSDMAA